VAGSGSGNFGEWVGAYLQEWEKDAVSKEDPNKASFG